MLGGALENTGRCLFFKNCSLLDNGLFNQSTNSCFSSETNLPQNQFRDLYIRLIKDYSLSCKKMDG